MFRKIAGLFLLFLGLYATLMEPYWMKLTLRNLTTSTLQNSIRILFFSDLQITKNSGKREQWILDQIKHIPFDLVMTTGDMFDNAEGMPAAVQFLAKFPSRAPTFAVFGNWELWSKADLQQYRTELEKRNVHLLINQNRTIESKGQRISVIGVNDSSQALHNLPVAVKGLPPNSFRILLAHGPAIFPQASANQIQLMLAGHTHGGQVKIPFIRPFFLPPGCGPYYYGFYKHNQSHLLVTSGVGTSLLPVRFACRPEIVLLTLS